MATAQNVVDWWTKNLSDEIKFVFLIIFRDNNKGILYNA